MDSHVTTSLSLKPLQVCEPAGVKQTISLQFFTGAQPKAATGHKMQSVPIVFERYIVRDISLTYFWKCSLAH